VLLLSLLTRVHPSCSPDTLAVYKLVLETHWNEKMFPKQYPQWRPPAQWSKTIGYSHSGDMSLFRAGSSVSDGVRMFVEKGDSDILEEESANKTFLDIVIAPPIQEGEGKTEALVFVDGNNTKVSFLTAIVPSPDWFVGLESVDLCPAGQWLDTFQLEVSPMDAGTDNGLTFTSPNWATDPRGEVFSITNTFPAHPAASFNYPQWKKLPTIAVYTLRKQREYNQIERVKPDLKTTDERYRYDVTTSDGNVTKIDFVPLKMANERVRKNNTMTESDTKHKSGKTSPQIISQYLTFDPVAGKTTNTTSKHTKHQEMFQFVNLNKNEENNKQIEKYAEILSNEIPELEFYKSGKLAMNPHTYGGNNKIQFIPVKMVTKTKRLTSSEKNKNNKTGQDIDNSLKTQILVANDGLQTRHKKRRKKKAKRFRSKSSLTEYHASTGPENFLKKKYNLYDLPGTEGNILTGNLRSLDKKELYRQILQSYKGKGGRKKLRKMKKKLRKRKNIKNKSPRNCQVSNWRKWGPCSVSCGIGESVRHRTVEQHSRHGGMPCPGLREYKWCGSARDCKQGYFDW